MGLQVFLFECETERVLQFHYLVAHLHHLLLACAAHGRHHFLQSQQIEVYLKKIELMFDILWSFSLSLHVIFKVFDILILLFRLVYFHLLSGVVLGGCGFVVGFLLDQYLVDVVVGVHAGHFEGLLRGRGGVLADLRH